MRLATSHLFRRDLALGAGSIAPAMPKPTGIDTALTATLGVAILLWATVLRHEPPPPDDERPKEISLTWDTAGRVTMGINGRPLARQPEHREALYRRIEKAYGASPDKLTLRCPATLPLESMADVFEYALTPAPCLKSPPTLTLEAIDATGAVVSGATLQRTHLARGGVAAIPDDLSLDDEGDARWAINNASTTLASLADALDASARKSPAGTALHAFITLRRETTFAEWVRLLPCVEHPRISAYVWRLTAEAPTALTTRLRRFTTDTARHDTPHRPAVR